MSKRTRLRDDAESVEHAEILRLKANLSAAEHRLKVEREHAKVLEHRLDVAMEQIEQQRTAKYSIPTSKRVKGKKGDFVRVMITDTHGCFANKPAVSAMLADLELLNPSQIIFMGDHLDCAGWLAKHHPFKTIQEARYSFMEDVEAANILLDEVQKRCPNAEYHFLLGNHESRCESAIVEMTAGHAKDAAYLRTMFSPEVVLNLEKRGMPCYGQNEMHMGLRKRGVIDLGNCYFTHGTKHGRNAAHKILETMGGNVVFAHVHKILTAHSSNPKKEFAAWCPGALCELEPMWRHGDPTDWSHGYGVQLVRGHGKDDDFLHLNIPIINGRSLLAPLLKPVAG